MTRKLRVSKLRTRPTRLACRLRPTLSEGVRSRGSAGCLGDSRLPSSQLRAAADEAERDSTLLGDDSSPDTPVWLHSTARCMAVASDSWVCSVLICQCSC